MCNTLCTAASCNSRGYDRLQAPRSSACDRGCLCFVVNGCWRFTWELTQDRQNSTIFKALPCLIVRGLKPNLDCLSPAIGGGTVPSKEIVAVSFLSAILMLYGRNPGRREWPCRCRCKASSDRERQKALNNAFAQGVVRLACLIS